VPEARSDDTCVVRKQSSELCLNPMPQPIALQSSRPPSIKGKMRGTVQIAVWARFDRIWF